MRRTMSYSRLTLPFTILVLLAVSAVGTSGKRCLAQIQKPDNDAKAAAEPSSPSTLAISSTDEYEMDLLVNPNLGLLHGTMSLHYRNNSSQALSTVRLRLDPNLNPKQSLEITGVTDEENKALPWTYRPLKFANWSSEKGAMEVTLDRSLPTSAEAIIKLEFHSTGNHINPGMVTLQDDPFQSMDGWYPKAMSYRDDGWSLDDDRPANYLASLRLPANYAIASSGTAEVGTDKDDYRMVRLNAEHIRGLTIYASPNWKRQERKSGSIQLSICLPPEAEPWADRILDAAEDGIAFYEQEYAPFPSRHLDIVCPGKLGDAAHGSSSSYNLVTIFLGGHLEEQYRFLVAHELAHQYFSTEVGFARDSIGWVPIGLGLMMDEHYARTRGLDATFGRKIMREFYFKAEQMGFDTTLSQSLQKPLQSPPPWSFGWNMSLAHGKAYAVCAMLRDLLGPETFQDVIRKLIREHAGGQITDKDLVRACEAALGEDLKWFTADWIDGRATFDYAIQKPTQSGDGWDIVVDRIGTGGFPALVEITTESGQRLRQRVDRSKQSDTLHFATQDAITKARIDPDDVYPDLDPANNVQPRANEGNLRAAKVSNRGTKTTSER